MTSHTEPSSREYQRQAEATRHRLAQHPDELDGRLTPGQVFDDVRSYARGRSGTFFRALSNAARENPVPSLLIGAGCMLFVSERMGLNRLLTRGKEEDGTSASGTMSGATDRVRGAATGAAHAVSSGAGRVTGSVRSGVGSATEFANEQAASAAAMLRRGAETVGDTMSRGANVVGDTFASASQSARDAALTMREQVAGTADQLKEGMQGVAGNVQEYSAAVRGQVAGTATRTKRQARHAAHQVKNTATSFINERPLLCAAIGIALGAAIAAALPSTETEDELMGDASDAVKDKAGEVASEQYETAKTAAGKVAQQAMASAMGEGVTAFSAEEATRGLVEKVKRVVTEAASAGASEIREKLDKQT
jgi:hypothetical protein